jgi:hypothetical protein
MNKIKKNNVRAEIVKTQRRSKSERNDGLSCVPGRPNQLAASYLVLLTK